MSMPPVIQRRASYGPLSPAVGERGARTRRQIVDEALGLFGRSGFHATSVDDIAKSAGISRATLYQYFESKEQIFLELLQESGVAQHDVLRDMGPLGPTQEGFDNLHRWLSAWEGVYDKYATTFVQCATVDSPKAPLRPMIDRWVEAYQRHLAGRLAEMPIEGIDAIDLAGAAWSMHERYSYYRRMRPTGLSQQTAVDNLAVVMQLMLFPSTPSSLLTIGGRPQQSPRLRVPTEPGPDWRPDRARFAELSKQSRRTVRQLLDAGGRVFTTNGYHHCSVEQIVAEAGLARGTFYKYFEDKEDLLVTLGRDCAEQVIHFSTTFASLSPDTDGVDTLRAWLTHNLAMHREHSGVFRMWISHIPEQPALAAAGLAASSASLRSFADVLRRLPRSYPLDPIAAGLMLHGIIERFPDRIGPRHEHRNDDQVVDITMQIIERGFLNRGNA